MKSSILAVLLTLSSTAFANYETVGFQCATEISVETYAGVERLAYGRTDFDIIAEEGRKLDELKHFLKPIKTVQKNEKFNRHLTDFNISTRVKNSCGIGVNCSKQKFKFNLNFSKKDLTALLTELNFERAAEIKSGADINVNVENITQIPELQAGYHGKEVVKLKNGDNGDRVLINVSCYLQLWGYGQHLNNLPEL